jgi:uncharacterized protein YjbI with pentapeptide repeats
MQDSETGASNPQRSEPTPTSGATSAGKIVQDVSAEKLRLETAVLEQQLSRPSQAREWIKALTGLGAVAALLAALFQLQQSYYQRADDRLERALGRLASPNVTDRLAGISTLRIVLDEGRSSERRLANSALANSLSVETDPIVSGAILDILRPTDTESRDAVLEELANGSRGLLPIALKAQPGQAFQDWTIDKGDFGRLQSLERAIVTFLHSGARTTDLRNIYCVECNFEGLDLSGVDFSGAVLNNSSFRNSNLTNSSFDHSVLLATNFANANLTGAKFTLDLQHSAFLADTLANNGEMAWGPDFSCANLENADFSRQEFLSVVENGPNFMSPGSLITPKFENANLKHTDFRSVGVYGALLPFTGRQLSPGSKLTFMRTQFPFPLDFFGLSDKPQKWDQANLGGVVHMEYLAFRGTLNPTLPMGTDSRKFTGSLNLIAKAFTHSNWDDAQLPVSLRQLLTQDRVATTLTGSCSTVAGQSK